MEVFRGEVYWEDDESCYYCGEIANTVDHVIPKSLLDKINSLEDEEVAQELKSKRKLTVPACKECNCVLSNSFQRSLQERKTHLKKRLRRRYKKLLEMPNWAEDELKEIGPNLRHYILAGISKKESIERRLRW
jgi:5-methylcytosine-specific restriction endonuclease McrA